MIVLYVASILAVVIGGIIMVAKVMTAASDGDKVDLWIGIGAFAVSWVISGLLWYGMGPAIRNLGL